MSTVFTWDWALARFSLPAVTCSTETFKSAGDRCGTCTCSLIEHESGGRWVFYSFFYLLLAPTVEVLLLYSGMSQTSPACVRSLPAPTQQMISSLSCRVRSSEGADHLNQLCWSRDFSAMKTRWRSSLIVPSRTICSLCRGGRYHGGGRSATRACGLQTSGFHIRERLSAQVSAPVQLPIMLRDQDYVQACKLCYQFLVYTFHCVT